MSFRDVFSVYHEGETGEFSAIARRRLGQGEQYSVKKGRHGGWRAYRGEDCVLWEGFRYGAYGGGLDIDTMTKAVSGVDIPVPSTYRKQIANWSRIDVVGVRPLGRNYPRESQEKRSLFFASFDYVVHYVETPIGVVGFAVRGMDYENADWAEIEKAYVGGKELPEEVAEIDSPMALENFLCSEWWSAVGKAGDTPSHRWRVEVIRPWEWSESFRSIHDAIDIYGSDWKNGKSTIFSAAELVAPDDSGRGAIVGIRLTPEGVPVMCMLLEFAEAMTLSGMAEFLGQGASGVETVMGDDEIGEFVKIVSGCGIPPVFSGSLLPYEGVFYG